MVYVSLGSVLCLSYLAPAASIQTNKAGSSQAVLSYSFSQQPWEIGTLLEEEETQPPEPLHLGSNLVHLEKLNVCINEVWFSILTVQIRELICRSGSVSDRSKWLAEVASGCRDQPGAWGCISTEWENYSRPMVLVSQLFALGTWPEHALALCSPHVWVSFSERAPHSCILPAPKSIPHYRALQGDTSSHSRQDERLSPPSLYLVFVVGGWSAVDTTELAPPDCHDLLLVSLQRSQGVSREKRQGPAW